MERVASEAIRDGGELLGDRNMYVDESNDSLLMRGFYETQLNEIYSDHFQMLDELVDYGTNLIPRCFVSSKRTLQDSVILFGFLKHIVSTLDGISLNAQNAQPLSCFLQLRSLVETKYIEQFCLENYEESYALYSYVWSILRNLETNEQKLSNQDFEEDDEINTDSITVSIASIKKQLSMKPLKDVYVAFYESLLSKGKKASYYPLGYRSLTGIVREALNLEDEFRIIYSYFSSYAHGDSYLSFTHLKGSQFTPEPIRTPKGIDQTIRHAYNYVTMAFHQTLKYYRPGELVNFARKYESDWLERFCNVPKNEQRNGKMVVTAQRLSFSSDNQPTIGD